MPFIYHLFIFLEVPLLHKPSLSRQSNELMYTRFFFFFFSHKRDLLVAFDSDASFAGAVPVMRTRPLMSEVEWFSVVIADQSSLTDQLVPKCDGDCTLKEANNLVYFQAHLCVCVCVPGVDSVILTCVDELEENECTCFNSLRLSSHVLRLEDMYLCDF